MDWTIISVLIAVISAILTAITLIFTGEWERIHGFLALFKVGRRVEVVVGVVMKGDLVLMVHRKPVKGERLYWQFPSGNLRTGEIRIKLLSMKLRTKPLSRLEF
jgi:hypothetical protein